MTLLNSSRFFKVKLLWHIYRQTELFSTSYRGTLCACSRPLPNGILMVQGWLVVESICLASITLISLRGLQAQREDVPNVGLQLAARK
jgi:hypothetical protein